MIQLQKFSPCHGVELCFRKVTRDVSPGYAPGLDAGHETQLGLRVRLDIPNHDLRTSSGLLFYSVVSGVTQHPTPMLV